MLRRYGEAMASEFGWCMVRAEDQDLSPDMSAHIKAMKSEIDQGIRRLMREGVQDGSIHPCDPEDDRVRPRRRAQLDRPLVSREPVDDRRRDRRAPVIDGYSRARPARAAARRTISELEDPTCRKPEVVIVSARRTPIGAFQGVLAPLTAPQLGAAAAKAAIQAAGIAAADLQEVILGCVLPAGLGQAPARQAAIGAGIPLATPATTINKMCGSGLKAVMMAADQIRAGNGGSSSSPAASSR